MTYGRIKGTPWEACISKPGVNLFMQNKLKKREKGAIITNNFRFWQLNNLGLFSHIKLSISAQKGTKKLQKAISVK